MNKVINPGSMTIDGKPAEVYCHIVYINDKLSITGVVGPLRNGDALGNCGQIKNELQKIDRYRIDWDKEKVAYFALVWDRWHLNDMRPDCMHQREWDSRKELTLTHYTWSSRFHEWRKSSEEGKMALDSYAIWQTIAPRVHAVTIDLYHPKYETPEIKALLDEDWIKVKKTEIKMANWVKPSEHPEGLLCKPCPVCGYKYGTRWLHEAVPADVIAYLEGLPENTIQPAWI